MDVTIGYGGASVRVTSKSVFVVRGCESAAVVDDEGWEALERAFFVGGAVLDHDAALWQGRPLRPRVWPWVILVGAGVLLCLGLPLALRRPAPSMGTPGVADVPRAR